MIRLDELKTLYERYCMGLSDLAASADVDLDHLIREAQSREAAVALDLLARVPRSEFSEPQFRALFRALVFWIQGPSRFYDKALSLLSKHGTVFLDDIRQTMVAACQHSDDSLVRGLCHVISLLTTEDQRAMRDCVTGCMGTTDRHVKEALSALAERSTVFSVPYLAGSDRAK